MARLWLLWLLAIVAVWYLPLLCGLLLLVVLSRLLHWHLFGEEEEKPP